MEACNSEPQPPGLINDASDPCHHQSLYTVPTLLADAGMSKTQRKVANCRKYGVSNPNASESSYLEQTPAGEALFI